MSPNGGYTDLKVPPHSVEAEQSVIGGLLLAGIWQDAAAWDQVSGLVTAADFYREDHRVIFRAIADLAGSGSAIDQLTVGEKLKTANAGLNANELSAYLGTLSMQTPSAANIRHYAEIVRNTAQLRRMISLAQAVQEAAFRSGSTAADVKSVMEQAASGIFGLEMDQAKGERGLVPIKPILKTELDRLDELSRAGGKALLGQSSGIAELDGKLLGLEDGKVYIIGAEPGMGKTTLGLNLLEEVAIGGGTCAFFSVEMPASQVAQKLITSQGRVDFGKLRQPWTLEDQDWVGVSTGVKRLIGTSVFIDDSSSLTPSEARVRVRRMVRETGKKCNLIMFDYVQIMTGSKAGGYGLREQEIADISREVRQMAKDFNCPVLLLSQLNRSRATRQNKRPIMSDLRESGALEQDAAAIIFIYRDEIYDPQSPDKGVAELIVAKNRGGELGTVRCAFVGKYQRFENIAHDTYPSAQYGGDWR